MNRVLERDGSRASGRCDPQRQGHWYRADRSQRAGAVAATAGEAAAGVMMTPVAVLRCTDDGHAMGRPRAVTTPAGQLFVVSVFERASGALLAGGYRRGRRIRSKGQERRRGARRPKDDERRAQRPHDATAHYPGRVARHGSRSCYFTVFKDGGGVRAGLRDSPTLAESP